MKRLMFIMNPCSGQRRVNRYLPEILRLFYESGYRCEPLITGAPAEGFAVSSIRVVPPYVTLAGSQEAIAPYLSEGAVLYPFEQIDISGRNQNVTSLNLALNTPGGVDYISNNAVTVIVTILPEEFVSVGGINGE